MTDHRQAALDLLKDKDLSKRIIAAAFPNNDAEALTFAFADHNHLVRREAIQHPNAPKELLIQGARDGSLSVVSAAVKHRGADRDVLIEAFNHYKHPVILEEILSRGHCPEEVLEFVISSPDSNVDMLRRAFLNKNATPDMLWRGIHHPHPMCRFATCLNSRATAEILLIAMRDGTSHIRQYATNKLERLADKM